MKHVLLAIRTESKFVLNADIKECFDRIDHEELLKRCGYGGKVQKQIRAWLKAGAMQNLKMEPTERGTPQGGVISPLLANIALDGFQKQLEKWCIKNEIYRNDKKLKKRERIRAVHYNRYADDIRIFCHDLKALEKITNELSGFLEKRGLKLNLDKTKITHTLLTMDEPAGTEYLGFKIKHFKSKYRSYSSGNKHNNIKIDHGIKLRIYPSNKKIVDHHRNIRY